MPPIGRRSSRALREQLRHGDESLVGNKGYRRYLSDNGPQRFRIDEAKIAEDARVYAPKIPVFLVIVVGDILKHK